MANAQVTTIHERKAIGSRPSDRRMEAIDFHSRGRSCRCFVRNAAQTRLQLSDVRARLPSNRITRMAPSPKGRCKSLRGGPRKGGSVARN
jgi:hypothetical protein